MKSCGTTSNSGAWPVAACLRPPFNQLQCNTTSLLHVHALEAWPFLWLVARTLTDCGVPAVLVRPDFQNVRELQRALIQLAANPDVRETLFNDTNNPEGYVFQSSVAGFIQIESSTPAYLGAAGRSIQSITELRSRPAGADSSVTGSAGRRR